MPLTVVRAVVLRLSNYRKGREAYVQEVLHAKLSTNIGVWWVLKRSLDC